MTDKVMSLPEGKTCADCVHTYRCTSMFGVKVTDTTCDFYPIRFIARITKDNTYLEEEYRLQVKDCIDRESKLSDWDRNFISSIEDALERGMFLTTKQRNKLNEIWERVT